MLDALALAAADRRIVIEEMDAFGGGQGRLPRPLSRDRSRDSQAPARAPRLPEAAPPREPGGLLASAEKDLGFALSEQQAVAVRDSMERKVMVITGGPGTGKTTIIKAIIAIQNKLGHRVLLAAPTGRAAKRMGETTGHQAKTIHRLLEFSPKDGRFKRDEQNPLDAEPSSSTRRPWSIRPSCTTCSRPYPCPPPSSSWATWTSSLQWARAACSRTSSNPAWSPWCASTRSSANRGRA